MGRRFSAFTNQTKNEIKQMPYNPNIHHRRSIRLKGYDYSQAGLYFVTICCHNHECLFGEIVVGNVGVENVRVENFQPLPFQPLRENQNPIMILNDAGKIADECWMEIPKHFPNAVLHEHIVMPNHVHGVIELTNDANVWAENFLPLLQQQSHNESPRNEFQKMIPRSIGSIVKGFKIGVTKWFRNNTEIQTVWQRNYHEHIIRNEKSYQTISNYIINNPSKWNDDKFFAK